MITRAAAFFGLILACTFGGCSEGHDRFYNVTFTSDPEPVEVFALREGKLQKIGTTPFSEKIRYTIGNDRRTVWRDPAGPGVEVLGHRAGSGSPYSIRSDHEYTLKKEGWRDQPIRLSASAGYLQPFADVNARVWMSMQQKPEATFSVVLDSIPSGAEVFEISESGMRGRRMGVTPLTFQLSVTRVRNAYTGLTTGYLVWPPAGYGRSFIGSEIADTDTFNITASFAIARGGSATQVMQAETLFTLMGSTIEAGGEKKVNITLASAQAAPEAAAAKQQAASQRRVNALAALRKQLTQESLQAEFDAASDAYQKARKSLEEARGMSALAALPTAGATVNAAAAATQVQQAEIDVEIAWQRMEIARVLLGR